MPPRFCDAQGMVHASRYHEFFEDAFLQWLDDNRLPYEALRGSGLDLVVGTTTVRYLEPARLGEVIVVEAHAARSTNSTISVDFAVQRGGDRLVEASITYVAAREGKAAPLPDELRIVSEESLAPEEILRRLHSAQSLLYAGGPAEALDAILHPDVSWHVPGHSAIAGHYHGRAEVLGYMARRRDLADRTFRMEARELLVGPSHFAALTDGTAEIGGVRHTWSTIGLYRTEDGQIRECILIPFDQDAFDNIWSPADDAT